MKINILFDIRESAYGGGNQFLKALRKDFESRGIYTDSENADVILFNSHHHIIKATQLKSKYPKKIFVHRIAGPIQLSHSYKDKRDLIVYTSNRYIADGTVFQSDYSRDKNYILGLDKNKNEATILNAPDASIFNNQNKTLYKSGKIKIVASSWSNNFNKGFGIYKFLDEHLDFKRYQMTFIGNSPITFKNITYIQALPSVELAKELKKNDIYLTSSRKDSCSNALLEALNCGLPAVALDDGGHPEILGEAGVLFNNENDILKAIEKISGNLDFYRNRIVFRNISETSEQYLNFMNHIYLNTNEGIYQTKKLDCLNRSKILTSIFVCRFLTKMGRLFK